MAKAAGMDTIVREGELLWTPPAGFAEDSTVGRFIRWLARERRLEFADYAALWRWSVDDLEAFWAAVWDFFEVRSSTPYSSVLERRVMPGARWFSGARLNFAEHVLRNAPRTPALVHSSELRPLEHMSWSELGERTRALAGALRELGIQPGERVVAYMPNIPETAIAMLATTAIGAVWSAAAPEFGARTVIDRFAQIEPSVLFVTDGYRFGGKDFERSAQIAEILAALPSLRHIVWLPYLDRHASPPRAGGPPRRFRSPRGAQRLPSRTAAPSATSPSGGSSRRERCSRNRALWTSLRPCSPRVDDSAFQARAVEPTLPAPVR